MPLSDHEIVENIRRGAKRDYSLLVDRYKDKAMTLAMRILRDKEDAEEALQDAFVRAYNGLDRFQGASTFGTWFYRIVYNVCLSGLGRRRRELQFNEFNDTQEYDVNGYQFSSSLADDIEKRDMADFVRQAISALPTKYSTILTLFYLQELTHEEICDVTQLPLGTVKVQLFRARALLHDRLQHELNAEKVSL